MRFGVSWMASCAFTCHNMFAKRTTKIVGTLNVTPDSFYDGGKFVAVDQAVAHAKRLVAQGADLIDIGGESSRPGSVRISAQEELDRVLPVVERLVPETNVPISIDTYKPEVANACLNAGAKLINDITGLRGLGEYRGMADVVAKHGALVCIMHMLGDPETMQHDPFYKDPIQEISEFLQKQVDVAKAAGIKDEQIILDPGIGFGKRLEDNLAIIKNLNAFKKLGYPVLIGVSRKSFLKQISGLEPEDRLEGTLAANVIAVMNGADYIRVHDVEANRRAIEVAEAIRDLQ